MYYNKKMDINKKQEISQVPENKEKPVDCGPDKSKADNSKKKTAAVVLILAAAVLVLIFGAGFLLKQKLHTAAAEIKNNSLNKVVSRFQKEKEYAPDTYLLEGVICDGEHSYAVINGSVFRLGEKVDVWELIKIYSSGVDLKNSATGKILSLSL